MHDAYAECGAGIYQRPYNPRCFIPWLANGTAGDEPQPCQPSTVQAHINPATLPQPSPVNNRGDRLLHKCALNACDKRFQYASPIYISSMSYLKPSYSTNIWSRLWPHECVSLDASRRRCGAVCTSEISGVKCLRTFKTFAGLKRHYDSVHIGKKLNCTHVGCDRAGDNGFTRRDNLNDHMRNVHGMTIAKSRVRFGGRTQDGTPIVVETMAEEFEGMD